MSDAKVELERIIKDSLRQIPEENIYKIPDYKTVAIPIIAQAILDKLPELVEIDKEKILDIISRIYYQVVDYNKLIPIEAIRSGDLIEDIATAICQAKGILRVRK